MLTDGYSYLPHFVLLFTPFRMLAAPWGHFAWMLVSVAWLGVALRRMARCLDPARAGRHYFFLTLLALPLCGGAIRNGQANVVFAAATVLSLAGAAAALAMWVGGTRRVTRERRGLLLLPGTGTLIC